MKITGIHCYFAIAWKNSRYQYITKDRKNNNIKFTLVDGIGVRLDEDKHKILVPFANIASIMIEDEVVEEPDKMELKIKKSS